MRYPYIFVGTYHKTGTVWMERVMRRTAEAVGVEFHYNPFQGDTPPNAEGSIEAGVYMHDHTRFPDWLMRLDFAGFRMIRDPRDVVVSGAHYHVKSDESWLLLPRELFGGQSYREAITALADIQAQYQFEMRNTGAETIRDMANPGVVASRLETVRYEELMIDADFSRFLALVERLGFDQGESELALKWFKRQSLVGGAKIDTSHATSSGKLERWRQAFSRQTAELFAELHGDALAKLGYAQDDSWVEECRD